MEGRPFTGLFNIRRAIRTSCFPPTVCLFQNNCPHSCSPSRPYSLLPVLLIVYPASSIICYTHSNNSSVCARVPRICTRTSMYAILLIVLLILSRTSRFITSYGSAPPPVAIAIYLVYLTKIQQYNANSSRVDYFFSSRHANIFYYKKMQTKY